MYSDTPLHTPPRIDISSLAVLAFILFLGLNVFLDRVDRQSLPVEQLETNNPAQPDRLITGDPAAIAAPYDRYTITQGIHGLSYGHMAVDLAAGRGAAIKSPINGTVSDLYKDEYGNPTLVIENERYRITMMHGIYTVSIGDQVKLGDVVGEESNKGYTTDMQGRPCYERKCGYHTHLNIFDKRIDANINPLQVLRNSE